MPVTFDAERQSMNTEHERIEHVFWRASQMESKTQREAFLAEACSGDDELRSEVDDLLVAMPAADKFAEAYQPIISSVGHAIGETIGRYKLQEKIGEGGFGIVFVAAQSEPVRRKVALKLI